MYYQCSECYHDFNRHSDTCPHCGAEFSMVGLCEQCGEAVEDHPHGKCPERDPMHDRAS